MEKFIYDSTEYEPIEFHNKMHPRIQVRPMYFESGFSAIPNIFGRVSVFNKLVKAMDMLPEKLGFLIWDVYRPRSVQAKLFIWMQNEIRKKFPHLTEAENYAETQKYMSVPSAIGDEYCPPHLSGGAIDLTLYEISSGNEFNMGTIFDDCSEKAHSNYFDLKTNLDPEEITFQFRRNTLRKALEEVGFTSYKYEWWHFDFGDIFWSRIVNKPAVFGPLFGDQEWPDNIALAIDQDKD